MKEESLQCEILRSASSALNDKTIEMSVLAKEKKPLVTKKTFQTQTNFIKPIYSTFAQSPSF